MTDTQNTDEEQEKPAENNEIRETDAQPQDESNTQPNKKQLLEKRKKILFIAFTFLFIVFISLSIVILLKSSSKNTEINEYIKETDFDKVFGKTISDNKRITYQNIRKTSDNTEKEAIVYKSYIEFEYRYIFVYTKICTEKNFDMLYFNNRFKRNNAEVSDAIEYIMSKEQYLADFKKELYQNAELENYIVTATENEMQNSAPTIGDVCLSLNSPASDIGNVNYKNVFPEMFEFIIKSANKYKKAAIE